MGELDYGSRHKLKPHDFAMLDRFEFKHHPVGFKFFNVEADLEGLGLEKLDSRIAWCEMLFEAQKGQLCRVAEGRRWRDPSVIRM